MTRLELYHLRALVVYCRNRPQMWEELKPVIKPLKEKFDTSSENIMDPVRKMIVKRFFDGVPLNDMGFNYKRCSITSIVNQAEEELIDEQQDERNQGRE